MRMYMNDNFRVPHTNVVASDASRPQIQPAAFLINTQPHSLV